MPAMTLRPIRATEWRQARDLRLRALQDQDAAIAFFTTYAEATARTEEQWRSSAAAVSVDAGAQATGRQFVAIDPAGQGEVAGQGEGPGQVTCRGQWVGTLTVRLEPAGSLAFGGGTTAVDRGMLLAVWIDPAHRGRGVLAGLVDQAIEWLTSRGVHQLALWVHEDNTRAQRAYTAAGFTPTGRRVVDRIGPEIELARDTAAT